MALDNTLAQVGIAAGPSVDPDAGTPIENVARKSGADICVVVSMVRRIAASLIRLGPVLAVDVGDSAAVKQLSAAAEGPKMGAAEDGRVGNLLPHLTFSQDTLRSSCLFIGQLIGRPCAEVAPGNLNHPDPDADDGELIRYLTLTDIAARSLLVSVAELRGLVYNLARLFVPWYDEPGKEVKEAAPPVIDVDQPLKNFAHVQQCIGVIREQLGEVEEVVLRLVPAEDSFDA